MKTPSSSPVIEFVGNAQPWYLLGGILFYFLGGGIIHYLGGGINWLVFWLGQACITMLQLSSFFLKRYYDIPGSLKQQTRKRLDDEKWQFRKPVWLQAAITTLTIGAVLTVILFYEGSLNPAGLVILGCGFVISFFYAVPPVRLVYTGYGELVQAVIMANLSPALAYVLQAGELHRLIAMITFPMTVICLAAIMAVSLRHSPKDITAGRKTLWVRIDWRNGMNLHNILILAGFLLLGTSLLLGLPWSLTWPGLLSLPIGGLQIIEMIRITNGEKPHWRYLTILAVATISIMAYSITLALWTG